MVDLWTNSFNGMDDGKEVYSIDPVLFKALGEIIENSGCTMPAAYGCRVPNLAAPYRGGPTAEAWNSFPEYVDDRALLYGRCAKKLKIHGTPLYNKICGHLVQTLGISTEAAKAAIPRNVIEWRRLRISQGGDTITAKGCQKIRSDARDSSFVRYSLLVDRHSRHRNVRPDLQPESQYGQLEHIFALPLKRRPTANDPSKKRTLLLALISEAPVFVEDTHEYKVISYAKGALKSGEVVDARTIQCLLGRVLDRNRFWIIDRSADCEFTFPTFH
ncbi:unnamed protein product [Rhizoctonia solani]|uniref:Uncharacterized protein n=1 Tax=Rhizoctonia solani TaxID=456999 RepID=A0A8H2XTU2_9AGAM|nr:unnamed protein product [Rhizoctonia solani]